MRSTHYAEYARQCLKFRLIDSLLNIYASFALANRLDPDQEAPLRVA